MTVPGGWRLVVVPIAAGILLAAFYDRFVGAGTALVIGGAHFLPSKRPRTLRNAAVDTILCAAGLTLVRELFWKR